MTTFDSAVAQTDAGQPMSISLPGGVSMSFTAHLSAGADGLRPVQAVAFPTWSGTPIGNTAYVGTAGKPALYQNAGKDGGWLGKVTLDNIVVRNSSGVLSNSGYALVMADAESSNKYEGFNFTSTSPIEQLANITPNGYNPACAAELAGIGTTSVTCTGQGVKNAGDIITYTNSPKRVAAAFHNDNDPVGNVAVTRQAVAFGVMFSKVQVTKNVASRYSPTDQFTVSTKETATGSPIAAASTSASQRTITTGETTLLAQISPVDISFAETISGEADASLNHYAKQWACTRNGSAVSSSLLTGGGTGSSVNLSVGVGDFVACSVTNSALHGEVSWSKVNPAGDALAGSEWSITGPNGFSTTVVDNGSGDRDSTAGAVKVDGLLWGKYSLTETKAPKGFALDSKAHTFTVDAANLNVSVGAITNTSIPPTSPPASPPTGARVNTGGTPGPSAEPIWWGMTAAGLITALALIVLRARRARHGDREESGRGM